MADTADAEVDLIPPLESASPRLRFHLGEVQQNQPSISPVLPDMPFPPSPYYIAQWHQKGYIRPDMLQQSDKATYDARLGIAPYAFEAPDGHAHVWIYHYGSGWLYELYEAAGSVDQGGGSNVFLTSDVRLMRATFDRRITFDFDTKLSRAAITASAEAQATGAVLSQVFVGFGLLFADPGSSYKRSVFMQLPISISRANFNYNKPMFFCSGQEIALFTPSLRSEQRTLPFSSDTGPLHHFHWVLNDYMHELVSSHACGMNWPASASLMRNWSLTGFYMGLETEAADDRSSAASHDPQGTVETAIQIANVRLRRQEN
jgi:hypothetical protein